MPRRILEGDVVSNKMDKTVTVLVERRFMHPVYKKYVKRTDKYAAHDESNALEVGTRVQIEECRPISKRKTWRVVTAGGVKVTVSDDSAAKKKAAPEKKEQPVKAAAEKAEEKKPAAKKAAAKKTTSKKKDADK